MKKVSILSLIALFAIVISSCGSSNNVVNNNGISKRKYTKGIFFQRKSNLKTANTKVEDAKLDVDKSVAKAEKVEAKKIASIEKKAQKELKRTTTNENLNVANIERTNMIVFPTEKEVVPETHQFLSDDEGGIEWSVIENQPSSTGESIEQMPYENRDQSSKNENTNQVKQGQEDVIFVLAVIFAILLPPLGVGIYTNIDWMKVLIAFLLTVFFILPGIIYALLVVFDKI